MKACEASSAQAGVRGRIQEQHLLHHQLRRSGSCAREPHRAQLVRAWACGRPRSVCSTVQHVGVARDDPGVQVRDPSGPGPRSATGGRADRGRPAPPGRAGDTGSARHGAGRRPGRSAETRMRRVRLTFMRWRSRSTSAESARHGRRLEEAAQRDLDAERVAQPGDQLGAEQRVPAEHEEVVFARRSRPAGAARRTISAIRSRLDVIGAGLASCSRLPTWARQCRAVVLCRSASVGNAPRRDERGRDHVVRQSGRADAARSVPSRSDRDVPRGTTYATSALLPAFARGRRGFRTIDPGADRAPPRSRRARRGSRGS